ncbi:LxmA leader domain family RiPP [Streptomyces sp. NPDC088746]|uniref:LxmA leader domain family RiPP n=1 Tax=Streptomyces sp. NPDC088746 TaxID=3365885 RepID=UPI00381A2F79
MNEQLIAGYAAYTTADEYGTAATGEAPASIESVSWAVSGAAVGASISLTVQNGC